MGRYLALAYGLFCYAIFVAATIYAIGFIGGFGVPKAIDDGRPSALPVALIVDAVLLGVFALQHSVMARPAFKALWTRVIPASVERSTYVLLSSLALALIFCLWRPIAQPVIWSTSTAWVSKTLWVVFALGWLIAFTSTFLIDHFDLFGIRQAWSAQRSGEAPPPEFRTPLFYRVVRHPLYLGFIIAFWATPHMTLAHFAFALATTGYVCVAIQLEERDLIAVFGDTYRRYRSSVSMIVPWAPRKRN